MTVLLASRIMTVFTLAILLAAGYGLYQWIAQRQAHEDLERERRQRYMRRYA